jgi:hypothetical protein
MWKHDLQQDGPLREETEGIGEEGESSEQGGGMEKAK